MLIKNLGLLRNRIKQVRNMAIESEKPFHIPPPPPHKYEHITKVLRFLIPTAGAALFVYIFSVNKTDQPHWLSTIDSTNPPQPPLIDKN
jgi:hypothetical protein